MKQIEELTLLKPSVVTSLKAEYHREYEVNHSFQFLFKRELMSLRDRFADTILLEWFRVLCAGYKRIPRL